MAASNTPIPDLVELDGLSQNTTYSVDGSGGGTILGIVDNATYSDSSFNNSSSNIVELYETEDGRSGTIEIDGTVYNFDLLSPQNSGNGGDVTVDDSGGGTTTIVGDGDNSDVVFIVATPQGGGATRYFALFSDNLGDIGPIESITTGTYEEPAANDHDIDVDQDNNVQLAPVCFVAGTLIATATGLRPVETVSAGDHVLTLDHGAQPVLGCFHRSISADLLANRPNFAPIVISAGALGPNLPEMDLRVSPQHRVLVRSKIAERMFVATEVLVRAKNLVGYDGVWRDTVKGAVDYYHILCRRHEIVFANGAPTETFWPGKQALASLSRTPRNTALLLMNRSIPPARQIMSKNSNIDHLLHRHRKNDRPLCSPL